MNNLPLLPPVICLLFSIVRVWAGSVQVYPAPVGEELSKDFGVQVEGKPIPVYVARVAPAEPECRWKAMDDKAHSADYFEKASFAYFDMQGTVTVTVDCPEVIQSAKVLPSSRKITPTIQGKRLSLTLSEPKPLTIEVNGDWVRSLHLFANPPESQVPIMRYNLVCYECQLGRLEQARKWLEKAVAEGDAKRIRLMALKDPDLKSLWREIGET